MKMYGQNQFFRDFPDEKSAIRYIMKRKYRGTEKVYKMKYGASYVNRKGESFNPAKGTVFYKMNVPIHEAFYAIFLLHYSPYWTIEDFREHIGVSHVTSYRLMKKLNPLINRRMGFIRNLNNIIDNENYQRDRKDNKRLGGKETRNGGV